ncbi:hypothetical protein DPMN_099364 [Dreissena polymorpha]|uniref:Uncharacterized protein n=1 Tax=Dreissena polymorpha TaxID=45954 RepID=A0A9D4R843_DREPO|nr:hypothetical protein DPMN_099364 [Dreissena polymorpha]
MSLCLTKREADAVMSEIIVNKRLISDLKMLEHAPCMVHVHCVEHCLTLACSDAAKDVPYLHVTHYKNTLKNLYVHVNGSDVRQFKLEALQEIMNEPTLRLKDPISIRWLSMEGAVKTIQQCYGSIVAYLQSNEGRYTVGDDIAEGLLKEVTHFKFSVFTAILSDILSVIQLQSDLLD